MTITIHREFTLCEYRCGDCGRHYAAESWGPCPMCRDARRDELFAETQSQARSIAQLRGQVTRLKKRSGLEAPQ